VNLLATSVGTQSVAQPVTITAYGNGPVTASVPSPFVLTQGSSCTQTPCTLYVAFAPTAAVSYIGQLTVNDPVGGQSTGAPLSGTGLPAGSPAVSLSANSLTFSLRSVGSTSIAQSVMLSNTGTTVLYIGSILLTGADPGDYVLGNGCGNTVAVGANCSFTVSFAPTAAGTRTANAQIVSNSASSPDLVTLSGTAQ
jgi:hypothetical protein